MTVNKFNKFKVILDIETTLTQDGLADVLKKLPELVHHVYKGDEESGSVVSLDVDISHLVLTDQKSAV